MVVITTPMITHRKPNHLLQVDYDQKHKGLEKSSKQPSICSQRMESVGHLFLKKEDLRS